MPILDDHEHLKREHAALLASYGRVQARCSAMLSAQARQIDALQAEAMQLRAAVIIRDTRLAWAGADRQALEEAMPGLARRVTLARQVEYLAGRVQSLVRARQAPTLAMPAVRVSPRGPVTGPPAAGKSVLCIGGDEGTTRLARVLAELSGARFLAIEGDRFGPGAPAMHRAAAPEPDAWAREAYMPIAHSDLEACLDAADLVICQTGCVSHGDFWRVQDHCKRHGKQCLLVDDSKALQGVSQVVLVHRTRAKSP